MHWFSLGHWFFQHTHPQYEPGTWMHILVAKECRSFNAIHPVSPPRRASFSSECLAMEPKHPLLTTLFCYSNGKKTQTFGTRVMMFFSVLTFLEVFPPTAPAAKAAFWPERISHGKGRRPFAVSDYSSYTQKVDGACFPCIQYDSNIWF